MIVDEEIDVFRKAYQSDLQISDPPDFSHLTSVWMQLKKLISSVHKKAQYLDVIATQPSLTDLSRCPWLGDVIEEDKPIEGKKLLVKENSVIPKSGAKDAPNMNTFKGRVMGIDAECRKETLELNNRIKAKGASLDIAVPYALEVWLQEQSQGMCGATSVHEKLWMKLWDQVHSYLRFTLSLLT